jgi:uncharacterized protein (DUF1697 family)
LNGGSAQEHAEASRLKTYIAFFRAINVGGKNVLPMKGLVGILEGLGARNVKTYIQSGNVVFESSEKDASRLSSKMSQAIKKRFGFEPHVLLLELEDIERAIKKNPFPEAASDPQGLHAGFLASVPEKPDLEALESLKANRERFRLIDRVFYLYAPEGIGRSKLAAKAEKLLGVPMTDRNWRTVCKIREMAQG